MKHFKKAISILLFAVFALSISMPALAQDNRGVVDTLSGNNNGEVESRSGSRCHPCGGDIIVFDIVDS